MGRDRKITIWIMIVTASIWIGWDIYAAISPEEGDTISENVMWYAGFHPVVATAVGVIGSHFFIDLDRRSKRNYYILSAVAVITLSIGFFGTLHPTIGRIAGFTSAYYIFGNIVGALWWGQSKSSVDKAMINGD